MATDRHTAPGLRRSWLAELSRRTGHDVTNWRTPAVDGLVSACVAPSSSALLAHALRTFAAERAAEQGALTDLLAEVDALWAVLEPGRDSLSAAGAREVTADAWVDVVATQRGTPTIDRLTGLHTPGYLIGRVHELDRSAGQGEPPHLMLLVARWLLPASPWLRAAISTHVAEALRAGVRPNATLCQLSASAAAALVPDDGLARSERVELARALDAEPVASAGATIALVPVPDRRDGLAGLLETLRQPPAEQIPARQPQVRMRAAE